MYCILQNLKVNDSIHLQLFQCTFIIIIIIIIIINTVSSKHREG